MNRHVCALALGLLLGLPFPSALAINKCAEPGGGFSYSDLPCPKVGTQVPFEQRPGSGHTRKGMGYAPPVAGPAPSADHPGGAAAAVPSPQDRTKSMQAYLDASRLERRRRELQRDPDQRNDAIQRLVKAQDAEVNNLRRQASYANNNLAGAVWENSLATQMNAPSPPDIRT